MGQAVPDLPYGLQFNGGSGRVTVHVPQAFEAIATHQALTVEIVFRMAVHLSCGGGTLFWYGGDNVAVQLQLQAGQVRRESAKEVGQGAQTGRAVLLCFEVTVPMPFVWNWQCNLPLPPRFPLCLTALSPSVDHTAVAIHTFDCREGLHPVIRGEGGGTRLHVAQETWPLYATPTPLFPGPSKVVVLLPGYIRDRTCI